MDYAIEMLNITKKFAGIVANDNVTLQLKKGEIHALLGENGAGKSTLMSVLFGMYQPEMGEILKEGKKVKIESPRDANKLGIGMVHQHFKLVENFTVLENIVLGVEETKNGFLEMSDANKKIIHLSEKYGLMIDPNAIISEISVGMQQRVEILKMLYRDNEILIFDEPTSVLTPSEIGELMKIMKNLVNEGKSILFITHKLDEIKEVADRCSVLRKGKYMGTIDVKDTSKEEMSRLMVGRQVSFEVEKPEIQVGETILKVENLVVTNLKTKKNTVDNVSFEVKRGEIVCIAGIDGNGQSELIYAISGIENPNSGKIIMNGKDITNSSVRTRNTTGMSHIPDDRHKYGLILDYDLSQNIALQTYFKPEFQNCGFIKFKNINEYADKLLKQFDVRCSNGIRTIARSMSGGNQQKAIIARELDKDPDILLAVQPTRGLDVGAIEYIHNQIVEQRNNNKAVLLVSLELEEVLNLADRILVIYEGKLVAEFNQGEVTREIIGLYMAGGKEAKQ